MKRTSNKSLTKLETLFPNTKLSDLEVLDNILTDRELEELERDHGIE